MSIWKPFHETARQAIVRAQEIATEYRSSTIGREHLFVGVLETKPNPAESVLTGLGVSAERAKRTLLSVPPEAADADATPREMVFDHDAKSVIERAFDEARTLGHAFISTAHMMLAIAASKAELNPMHALGLDSVLIRERLITALESLTAPSEYAFVEVPVPLGSHERATGYYANVLGLNQDGGFRVHPVEDPEFSPGTVAFGIAGSSFQSLTSRIQAHGYAVEMTTPAADGSERAFTLDPFGNRIVLRSA